MIVHGAVRPRVRRTVEVWPPCPGQHAPCYKIFTTRSQYLHRLQTTDTPSDIQTFLPHTRVPWPQLPWSLIGLICSPKWFTNLRPPDHWPIFPGESQSSGSPLTFPLPHPPTKRWKRSNQNLPWIDAVVWLYQAFTSRIRPRQKTD